MDRQKFIDQVQKAYSQWFSLQVDRAVKDCNERTAEMHPGQDKSTLLDMSLIEEMAELTEALSRKMRGRTTDNYDILQEMADVILDILCVAEDKGITKEDLIRAVNVKIGREAKRAAQWEEERKDSTKTGTILNGT